MKYTVLLLYPDYIGNYGEETYLDHIVADNVEEAKTVAQVQAAYYNDVEEPDDFGVLAVFEGHLEDLK